MSNLLRIWPRFDTNLTSLLTHHFILQKNLVCFLTFRSSLETCTHFKNVCIFCCFCCCISSYLDIYLVILTIFLFYFLFVNSLLSAYFKAFFTFISRICHRYIVTSIFHLIYIFFCFCFKMKLIYS